MKSAGLDKITVSKSRVRMNRKQSTWPLVDTALYDWVYLAQSHVNLTGAILKEKAATFFKEFYPDRPLPVFSNGWLHRFQARQGVRSFKQYGESGSAIQSHDTMISLIRDEITQYRPGDVFNCDESGLFWKMIPDTGLATMSLPGRKKDKSRITVHFCCNADGSERLPLWYIGSAKAPKAFKGININSITWWRHNKKAWMNTIVFEEWLRWFDSLMNRHVLLLMDNFSAHELGLNNINASDYPLQYTKVIFLPPNATSIYQPLDQGIIHAWKKHWRKLWITYMLKEFDSNRDYLKTMNVLQAIRWGNYCWSTEITAETIQNCFQKALDNTSIQREDTEIDGDLSASYTELQQTQNIRSMMDINQFLNPIDEQVIDPVEDIETHVIESLQDKPSQEEPQDEIDVQRPHITYATAIQGLQHAQLLEEERPNGSREGLHSLYRLEKSFRLDAEATKSQKRITSFFRT